jgi:hypothetical protein
MVIMAKIKSILGAVSASGLSLGGLIMAGKSGFGKKLGERPEETEDDYKTDEVEKVIVDTLNKVLDEEEETE